MASPAVSAESTLPSSSPSASGTAGLGATTTVTVVEKPVKFQIFVNVPNGDYVRLEVTTLDKIEHIKRQLFLMNKTWDMSRQRIMFNTWGQQQKCSRWGAAVLSTQPTVVRRPLPAEERLTVIGVGPECVLDMQLVDPL